MRCLAAFGLDADRARHAIRGIPLQILQHDHAGTGVLDQNRLSVVSCRQAGHRAPQIGILVSPPVELNQVIVVLDNAPGGADRIVVGASSHRGGIPALDDIFGCAGRRQLIVPAKPFPLDEIAFERHRPLLVLRRELQAADFGLDPLQHQLAFAPHVQEVAGATAKDAIMAAGDDAIFDGDGRQIEVMPATCLQQMTCEIVFMQALHHHDDAAGFLIVQARDQGASR